MNKKLLAFPLALALTVCICSVSAFAEGVKSGESGTLAEAKAAAEKATNKPNAKLKKDVEKLLADVKAGKVAPAPQQFPPATRNNLSKTTKIAILAAAIGASITLIAVFHALSKD